MEYWIKIGLTTVMIVAISGMQAKLSCHKAIIDGKVCGKKICPINDSCEDTSVCPCMDGYRSFNETRSNRVIITCEDKLECVEGTHACGANTRCDNTDGGYYCVCNKGFHRGNTTLFCPTDNKAENVCSGLYVSSNKMNEISCRKAVIDGKVCGKKLCPINDSCEDTSECPCMDGYRSFNETLGNRVIIACDDKLECIEGTHACGMNSRCDNTEGGYYCVCNQGFQRGNTTQFCPADNKAENVCSDIDECKEDSNRCLPNAHCKNIIGSYQCVCMSGFRHISNQCIDIDECKENSNPCVPNAHCKNVIGSYHCVCMSGFRNISNQCIGCTTNITEGEYLKYCVNQNLKDPFCSVLNVSFSLLNYSCKIKTNDTSKKEAQEEFQQAAEKLSQALANNNLIADNAHRGNFITVFLNSVERVVLLSFLESPRVQHINTPELDITMKPSYNICSPAVQSFTLVSDDNIMEVPCNLVSRDGDGAIFITYKEFHFNFNGNYPQKDNKVVINSKVVTGAITNSYSKSLSFRITFRLSHLQPLKPFDKPICVFWDPAKNDWSDKGCETGQSNGTHTNCYCTHLSSFALLMAVNGKQVDFTLNILSYFGLSISVICLGLSLLTFILCRSLRSAHTSVLTALCGCLFLGQLLFMVGIHQTWNRLLCALIAGWLQFLFLCAFCWMTVESVLLFMTVQNLRAVNYMASQKSNFPFLCLLGFGVPVVIVGISSAVRSHQYGTEKNCWLSPGIVWSFIGPVGVFITINTILLVITLWLLKKRISSLNANVSTLKNTRVLTFKAVAQLFILGCTWGIGYFQFGHLSLVISYLFTICNSLQGAFIFLVHCLLNQQVREEYCKLFYRLCTHKKQRQDISTISALQTVSKPPLVASTDSNCDCELTQPAVLNKNMVNADNSPAEKKEQSL